MAEGWRCPGCGKCLAPHVDECRACSSATAPAPVAAGPTFAELWPEYEVWGEASLSAWRKVNKVHGDHLLRHFGALPWTECGYAAADRYVAKRRKEPVRKAGCSTLVHPRTIEHELSTAKAFFNWSVRRQRINRNPLDRYEITFTKEDLERMAATNRKFHIPEEDFVRLMEAANPTLCRVFLATFFETGCRRDELRLLEDDEVDLAAKVIRLPAHRTKARTPRTVPLTDVAVTLLEHARRLRDMLGVRSRYVFQSPHQTREAPVSRATLWNWMDLARTKADVKGPKGQDVWLHTLRKSFGTITAMLTQMPVRLQMEILGHASEEVHRGYLEVTAEHAQAAREHLNERRRRDPQAAAVAATIVRLAGGK